MRDPRTKLNPDELRHSNVVAAGLRATIRKEYDSLRTSLEATLDAWEEECVAEDRAALGCNPSVTDGYKHVHAELIGHIALLSSITNSMATAFNEALEGMDEPPPQFFVPGPKESN